ATAATVTGRLDSRGAVHDVILYYGLNDAGTNASAWSHSRFIGSYTNGLVDLQPSLTGLIPTSTYYVTFRATNCVEDQWGGPSRSLTTTVRSVDLEITKTVTPTILREGTNLTYTLVISNRTALLADHVVVTDSLPNHLSFAGSLPPPDLIAGNSLTYHLGPLGGNGSRSILLNLTVDHLASTALTNAAVVYTSDGDTNMANNTALAVTALPDFDGDGLPDYRDPDDDNDTYPDDEERLADTDPYDPNSLLWIRVDRTAARDIFTLTHPSSSNRSYFIQDAINLLNPVWTTIRTNLVGTGHIMVHSVTNQTRTRYFRIGVASP
ncbi:MAG: DUF11 domain-containing protein, partial [Verrucomicrobiota bacterium]